MILASLGCRPDPELVPLVTLIEAGDPVAAEVVATVGDLELDVLVRLLNRYDASVAGGDLAGFVSGASAAVDSDAIAVDPTGYGELQVSTSAPEAFSAGLLAAMDDDVALGDPVTCWSVAGEPQGWGLRQAWALPDALGELQVVQPLLEGFLLATDLEVWFQGAEPGARAHRVLTMPDPILEVEAVHVDNDGVPDALVRSVDEVILLRGRPGGGMAWGAGFAAEGRSIQGISVADADADQRNDVGFVLEDYDGAMVVIMLGDGGWGFSEWEEARYLLDYAVTDLELAHSDQDGQAELNVLKTTSILMRYYWGDEGWAETYPSSLETHLADPATFLGAADLDLTGSEDPIMLSHPQEGVDQSVLFYAMGGTTTQYQKSFLEPSWALGDLSGDLGLDVVALEDTDLHLIHFEASETDSSYKYHTITGVLGEGPIAVGLFDGDSEPDLVVADGELLLYAGSPDSYPWWYAEADWSSISLDLLGAPQLADFDDKAGHDTLSAWVDSLSIPVLRTWWLESSKKGGLPELVRRGDLELAAGSEPLGLGLHGGLVYGLFDEDGEQLAVMDLDEYELFQEQARVAVSGQHLRVGDFADGAVVAVVSDAGAVSYRDSELVEVATGELGSFECLAVGDTDGDEVDELLTGSDSGCELVAADLDGDGADDSVQSSEMGIYAEVGGESFSLQGDGWLGAADLDGDGAADPIVISDDRVLVHRALQDGFAPPFGLHTSVPLQGSPLAADIDGDGVMDLLVPGEEGSLLVAMGE